MSNDEILNKSTNGNTPLISVCMPVYNRGMYIRDCIESVLSQSFRNFDLSSWMMVPQMKLLIS